MGLKSKRLSLLVLLAQIILLLFPLTDIWAGVAENYYVSPSGNDESPGTEAEPFRTIEKAKAMIREQEGPWTGDICVWLREGTYRLKNTLVFSEEDSGRDGYSVIYKAMPGEKPVISGGEIISGWTQYSGGIYKAECPEGIPVFRQLYVKGKRAVRARTPNKNNYNRLSQWRVSSKSIRVPYNDVNENWQNISGGKVEMIVQQYWAESIMRIVSVSPAGPQKDIGLNPTERDIVFEREWPQKSPEQAYHIENSLDFIDEGGEWFLDDNTTPFTLYYKPRSGEDMSQVTVIVPTIEKLISIKGPAIGTNVTHLTFQGIIFEHSNWARPSTSGNIGLQQQQYSIGGDRSERPEAGIFIQNADHLNFTRNVFRNMGSTGLDIYTATNNIVIEGNVFYDIAGNGIQLGMFSIPGQRIAAVYNPPDPRVYCEYIRVSNNYIHNVACDYYCGSGIAAGYVRYTDIVHNEITDLPYTGISVGWGWTKNPCAMTNNTISYNRIHNVVNLLCDGAGIYTLGFSPNSVMKGNFIEEIVKSPWATTSYTTTYPLACIYLDQGSKGYTIEENVLREAHNNNYVHEGMNTYGDNIIKSNYRSQGGIEAFSGIQPQFQDIKLDDGTTFTPPLRGNIEYKVYPTVATHEITVDLTVLDPQPFVISVYNTLGIKMREYSYKNVLLGTNMFKLNVADLAAGQYLILIRTKDHAAKDKIQVIK